MLKTTGLLGNLKKKNEKTQPKIENFISKEAHSETPWRPCAVDILKAGTFSSRIKPGNIIVFGQKSAVMMCYQIFLAKSSI